MLFINEFAAKTKQQQMRDLLLLCSKKVHFSYNRDIFTQAEGMATDSSLASILASILMVELEKTVLPNLREHMSSSKRHVDDTIPT